MITQLQLINIIICSFIFSFFFPSLLIFFHKFYALIYVLLYFSLMPSLFIRLYISFFALSLFLFISLSFFPVCLFTRTCTFFSLLPSFIVFLAFYIFLLLSFFISLSLFYFFTSSLAVNALAAVYFYHFISKILSETSTLKRCSFHVCQFEFAEELIQLLVIQPPLQEWCMGGTSAFCELSGSSEGIQISQEGTQNAKCRQRRKHPYCKFVQFPPPAPI